MKNLTIETELVMCCNKTKNKVKKWLLSKTQELYFW